MFRDILSPPVTLAGQNFAVVNQRSLRASSGLLLLLGLSGWFEFFFTGNQATLRVFAIVFIVEHALRLILGWRWSPLLLIAGVLVRKQSAEWAELRPKETAWIAEILYTALAFFAVGWIPTWPTWATLVATGVLLAVLLFESVLGFCLGCWLHARFSKTPSRLCPSGAGRVA